ncbi:MAG: cell wall hydrolase [Rhizobiales bacterium]|nr:cell wall hydrolase [Hyphomicrobiales bacterium]NRB13456.1 cell wall hydrolase [Hyphomicrobiales bacterium]
MNQNKHQHSDAQLDMDKNHKRRKKAPKITRRTAMHVLIGLACIGLFWAVSTQINQPKINAVSVQIAKISAMKPIGLPLVKPPLVDLQQLDDELYFENATAVFETKNLEIKVNRTKKRDSTYRFAPMADNGSGLRVSKDNLQIAALNPKLNLQQLKIDQLTQQLQNAQPLNAQPTDDELVRAKSNVTKILTADEIEHLKQDLANEKLVLAPEKNAPMPTISTGDEQPATEDEKPVEEIDVKDSDQNSDQDEDQETSKSKVETTPGAVKTSDLIKKPNAIVVVDGKIATKQVESQPKYITLTNVKVPAPLKRPIYIPKVKKPVTKKNSTKRSSLTCLTTALYHEVRGESRNGQLAVAEVIASRKASKSYPNTICEVVYQNATKRNKCQFSFACDGKTDLPRDLKTWNKLKSLAKDFLAGRAGQPDVRGATHYHATYVSPKWRWTMNRIGRIGNHIFYRDPRAKS